MPLPYGIGSVSQIAAPSIAYPGLVLQRSLTREVINLKGSAPQIIVITLGTPAASTYYAMSVNGVDASFTTASTVTAQQLQDQAIGRLSSSPIISGSFSIVPTTSTTITLTATQVGVNVPVAFGSPLTFTNTLSTTAQRVPFGRVVSGTIPARKWVDNLRVAGLPVDFSIGEEILGVTQYSHGLARDIGTAGGFISGDPMSLVSQGQVWMEFSAAAVLGSAAQIYFQGGTGGNTDTGRLFFGTTPPSGYLSPSGTWSLDSETYTIADGRIVGLVSISL